ncbi:prolyl 4-hydroxylase subunit alpha-1-like isoform X2 [Drosophila ficusphila]|uniref:prolyl 4-hydroxylase subunit alpha-1-like isoform X2 n=1 Tax=Drosophila ficusphila TaxID=30025 RepID=UPI001C892715|nr:prolyl 4-hydroxylase subunit alpha-1-like isoform X2 [Drosophila ficusphila]
MTSALLLKVSIICISILIIMGTVSHKNYITSKEKRMQLLEKDRQLIILLNSYAVELQDKIDTLRGVAKAFRERLYEANGREEEYLSNPLKNLFLVRQMHEDWDPVEKFMQQTVGQDYNSVQIKSIEKLHQDIPSQDDLNEASQAIFQIIHAYDLEPKDVARGLVDGVQYSGNLSAKDCIAMGRYSLKTGNFKVASKWLNLAKVLLMDRPRKYHEVMAVTHTDVALLLARYLIGRNVSSALEMLTKDSMFGETGKAVAWHFYDNAPPPRTHLVSTEWKESFNHLCRSVSRRQSKGSKPMRLHCRYNTTTAPFLKLAPFRMEELSLSPYIVLYHNVLSDGEIEKLERMSELFLKRSTVINVKNNTRHVSPTRTADGVWLPLPHTKLDDRMLLSRISLRIGDLTGLDMTHGRAMQFLKYGFGGHFVPHHDYFNSKTPLLEAVGDRFATVLFYLNNVAHGGATAFPKLNIAVPTQKGSALFWHNIDGQSYDYEDLTFHGACPLISGTKMVLTRWIDELDQMFLLPAVIPPRSRNFSSILRNSVLQNYK